MHFLSLLLMLALSGQLAAPAFAAPARGGPGAAPNSGSAGAAVTTAAAPRASPPGAARVPRRGGSSVTSIRIGCFVGSRASPRPIVIIIPTVTRIPLMQGFPPLLPGSIVIIFL